MPFVLEPMPAEAGFELTPAKPPEFELTPLDNPQVVPGYEQPPETWYGDLGRRFAQGAYKLEADIYSLAGRGLKTVGAEDTGQEFLDEASRLESTSLGAPPVNPEGLYSAWKAGDTLGVAKEVGRLGPKVVAESLPMMIAAGVNGPGFYALLAEDMAREQAKNSGRTDPTWGDYAVAAPFAVISGALERWGLKGLIDAGKASGASLTTLRGIAEVAKNVGKATAREVGTEMVQEPTEYVGEAIGTQLPPTLAGAGERSLMGGIGGLFGGGAMSAVTTPINMVRENRIAAEDAQFLLERIQEGELMPQQPGVPPAENTLGWPASVSGFQAPEGADLSTSEGRQAAVDVTLSTEEFADLSTRAKAAVTQELDRLGLKDFDVQTVDRLFTDTGDAVDAEYRNRIFKVALDTPLAELPSVMNHEVIHALKEMGAFTKEQWTILERSATQRSNMDPARLQQYIQAYVKQGMTRAQAFEIINEEAVGDMHREFHDGRLKPMGTLKKALQRIDQFFEATGNGLRGLGFTSSAGIMEAIQQGKFGVSAKQQGQLTGPRYSLRQPKLYSALERMIKQAPDTPRTGAEWLQYLMPKAGQKVSTGVKQEELHWTIKPDLLRNSNKELSKAEVLDLFYQTENSVRFFGGDYGSPEASSVDFKPGVYDMLRRPGSRWETQGLTDYGIRLMRSQYEGGPTQWEPDTPNYHFNNPNVAGWYRYGTLTSDDGKQWLFIDEVQSDWQQNWRGDKQVDPRPDAYRAVKSSATINAISRQQMLEARGVKARLNQMALDAVSEAKAKYAEGSDLRRVAIEALSNIVSTTMHVVGEFQAGNLIRVNTDQFRNNLHDTINMRFNLADGELRGFGRARVTPEVLDMQRWVGPIMDKAQNELETFVTRVTQEMGSGNAWDILDLEGKVVEAGYVPDRMFPELNARGAEGIIASWLETQKSAVARTEKAPAGPYVKNLESYARMLFIDAVRTATAKGLDGIILIPGKSQLVRNGKSNGDFVETLYDSKLQKILKDVMNELGGYSEASVEVKGSGRDIDKQLRGALIPPTVTTPNILNEALQALYYRLQSLSNSLNLPYKSLDRMERTTDLLRQSPRAGELFYGLDTVIKNLMTGSTNLGQSIIDLSWTVNDILASRTGQMLDSSTILQTNAGKNTEANLFSKLLGEETLKVLRSRPEHMQNAKSGATVGSIVNSLTNAINELATIPVTDSIRSTRDILFDVLDMLQNVSDATGAMPTTALLRRVRSQASPETPHGTLAERILLEVVNEAYAADKKTRDLQSKGANLTAKNRDAAEVNGARKFAIRRAANRQTTTNPQVAQQMYSRLNRIYGTDLDAKRLGQETARFNWFMKNILTLPQVERENWDVPGVRPFVDSARRWWGTKGIWASKWDKWIAQVRDSGYGKAEQSKLWRFANEVTVLSDELGRQLTPAELQAQARRVGGLEPGLFALWQEGRAILQEALDKLEILAKARVVNTWNERLAQQQDIVLRREMENARDKAVRALEDDFQTMRNRDYWPLARFGEFTVNVVAKVPLRYMGREFKPGETVLFELYETEKEQTARKAALLKAQRGKVDVAAGKVDESIYSFQGLPPSVLRMLEEDISKVAQDYLTGDQTVDAETLKMLQEQLNALRTAMLHFTPENAFKQRLLRRKGTRGFTDDGLRAMASLGQSFAGHIARAEHRGEMDDALKILDLHRREMEFSTDPAMARQGNKLTDLLNYLRKSQRDMMNPGNDLANLRALGFLWYLGAVPRAALVQVWQPFATTYPWLASRYGDSVAVAEMGKAYADIVKLFKGRGGGLEIHMERAIELGMQQGFLDQSLFTELAGVAEGSNLQRLLPGKFLKSQEAATQIRKAGYMASYLFQKGEELNRLVTFKAAYMAELRKVLGMEGSTEREIGARMTQLSGTQQGQDSMAQAFLAGRTAVEATQGEYARWARPEIMRGKKSAIFLFKMYSQMMNYFAIRDPGKWRFLGIQLAIAGALGLPFAEDILDILNAATQGKLCDTGDVRNCMREYINELGANPELVMHGLARYAGPWDLSANMSLGSVVPGVEPLARAMMPGGSLTDNSLRLQTEALGALFAIPLNFAKALSTGKERDFEQAMPTVVRDVYRTIRRAREGGEVSRSGEMLASIDWSDPGSVITHLGQAVGFRPREISAQQEMRWSQKEAAKYWGGRREAVVEQFYHLYKTEGTPDREALADVMKAVTDFNASVPYPEMAISATQLRKGLRASIQRKRLGEGGVAPEKKYRRLYSEVAEGFAY